MNYQQSQMESYHNTSDGKINNYGSFSTHHRTKREKGFEDTTPLVNQYRQTLRGYQKMFLPRTTVTKISIQPVAKDSENVYDQNQQKHNNESQINIQQMRLQYTQAKSAFQQKGSIDIPRLQTPSKTPFKSFTATKAKKKITLQNMINQHSKPGNLEFQLHKQRFFQTFMKKKDVVQQSQDKLKSIRKRLILQ